MAALILCLPAWAARWPTSRQAMHWHPTSAWLAVALCIHRNESADWHRNHTDWLGRWSPYSGGMEFLTSTWLAAGGTGEPWEWSSREQLYRAFIVVARDRGWSEWGSAARCGV